MSDPSDEVRDLSRRIMAIVWEHAKRDAVFRKKLLADPEETLKSEGLDEIDNFIIRLKTVDEAALEAGLQSGETNATC